MHEFNLISQDWNDKRKEESTIFKAIKPLLEKGINVLDAGCGNGRNEKGLTEYFQKVYAIDSSEELIKLALKNNQELTESGKVIFSLQDYNKTLFEDNFFDCIVAIASLHHSKDLNETFTELNRILRPRGKLVFSLWNYYQPKFYEKGKEQSIKWGEVQRYYHFYEEDEMLLLVKKYFKLEKSFYESNGNTIENKFEAENFIISALKI